MTGFIEFAHFGEAFDPQVNTQDIENELNKRLELACSIKEALSLCINSENKKNISYKSQFFGRAMFGEVVRVPIFWTWPVWRKREIPNFLVRNRVPILGHPVYISIRPSKILTLDISD